MGTLKIDRYLEKIIEIDGSDLHVSSGMPPKIRVHGELREISKKPFNNEQVEALLLPALDDRRRAMFEERKDLDWAYAMPGVARFRCSYFRQQHGMGGVFRLIPEKIKPVEDLGVPKHVERFCEMRNGLVLCTGPTGSGKSTTLAALVDYINRNHSRHIVTIEEPIEFVHVNKKSQITQREIGIDSESFSQALRSVSRQDPDVVLVGELRDLETIGLAITAAEMGYLVFATLHTNSAAKTIDRIIDVFPEDQQNQVRTMLSTSLKGVIAQFLIPRKDGKGRAVVNELLFPTGSLPNIIREGAIHKIVSLIEGGRGLGMQLMDDSILARYKEGAISGEIAHRWAFDKRRFQNLVKR
ncbi:MAG TPA: PilT/PilU family type 4a pilus ATPase [Planctomycetes bacterium]|nr:PilT/PilU family type 4a pilus ATPase [Planctomycetota bacterium]HIN79610.1 PilT/PilU family type 4a pilus ATPase [Planctomycetota bacterium]